jgi:nucleoside-diphosphate-sugar epimerase
MSRRKRILVTGATGFLGRNILEALGARDDLEVIAACRNPRGLSTTFVGERRVGDLLDAKYRAAVVSGIDVVCHAGTWAAVWGHARKERSHFFDPTTDLVEQSIRAGVSRFLMSSSIVAAGPPRDGLLDDRAPGKHTGFWPHLDRIIDVEEFMRKNAGRGTTMVALRLGEFVGVGNTLGLVPALAPRLKTRLVPLIDGGRSRLPLIADADLGQAFLRAAVAPELDNFESFNICGTEFPSTREVFDFLSVEGSLPKAWYSVPKWGAYLFGWLMERLHPILPGKAPFLTRSIVYLAEDWPCAVERAEKKLGYRPQKNWRDAVGEAMRDLRQKGYPWPALA